MMSRYFCKLATRIVHAALGIKIAVGVLATLKYGLNIGSHFFHYFVLSEDNFAQELKKLALQFNFKYKSPIYIVNY